jgi:hypothetical protein
MEHAEDLGISARQVPKESRKGNQYIMVLTEIDSNAMLVEPMKNCTSGEMIRAYQALID